MFNLFYYFRADKIINTTIQNHGRNIIKDHEEAQKTTPESPANILESSGD